MNNKQKFWFTMTWLLVIGLWITLLVVPRQDRHYAHQGPLEKLSNNIERGLNDTVNAIEATGNALDALDDWAHDRPQTEEWESVE